MRHIIYVTYMICSLCVSWVSHATTFTRPGGAAEAESVGAGYVALFTCSAHFIAGREWAQIKQTELVDILPFDPPEPEIDQQRQLVRAQDHQGNTAVAAFRDTMGCTLLPPNWREADVARLPYAAMPKPPDVSSRPFPAGDRVNAKPNRSQRAVLKQAFDGQTFGEGTVTIATIVLHNGSIVGERYAPGFGIHSGYRTWSTAKSITATLLAIAARDGIVDLDAPANIPEWRHYNDPRAAITLKHLLWMSSGLQSYGANTNAIYFGGQDVISAATGMPLEAPVNTRWKYANNDTLLLLRALRASLDDDLRYLRYPYDELFHRIGMFHTRMEVDHRGNFIGSSQVYTTARDLARFGLLYLNDGQWEGQQLLPNGWTEFVAQAAPALPREPDKQGYGAQFWLYDSLDGIPAGTYTTAGNKGQFVTIVPAHNMVVVRTGVDPNGIRWQQDGYIKAVIEAFEGGR